MIDHVNAQLKTALLAGDKAKVDTLKMLKSALLLEVKNKVPVDDLTIVRRQIKMRTDAAESYKNAGMQDKADKELSEAQQLEEFLPQQMSAQDLTAVVDKVVADEGLELEAKNMGRLIGAVIKQVGDKASKADIASTVKSKLN